MVGRSVHGWVGLFVALLVVGWIGAGAAADCRCPQPFLGVVVRNRSCTQIQRGEVVGRKGGRVALRTKAIDVCPRARGFVAPTWVGTSREVDKLSIAFCTDPASGQGLHGSYPKDGTRPKLIRSAFVFVDCDGQRGYLRIYFACGSEAEVPLTFGQMDACFSERAVAPAAMGPMLLPNLPPDTGTQESDDLPFEVFKVRNRHATRTITRAVIAPHENAVAKRNFGYTALSPGNDAPCSPPEVPCFPAGKSPQRATHADLHVCLDDGTGWTCHFETNDPGDGDHRLGKCDVELRDDGLHVTAFRWHIQDEDGDDTDGDGMTPLPQAVTCTPQQVNPAVCPVPLQFLRVINQHGANTVVRVRATPNGGASFLQVDNVTPGHQGLAVTATTHEASSVLIEVCTVAQGVGARVRRTLSVPVGSGDRIQEVVVTYTALGQIQILETDAVTWLGTDPVLTPETAGNCPIN